MVFPILLVQFVKNISNHRVHKRADGFYHGRKTVSFLSPNVVYLRVHVSCPCIANLSPKLILGPFWSLSIGYYVCDKSYLKTCQMRRYRHIGTHYFSYLRRYFCLFTLIRVFKKHLVYSIFYFNSVFSSVGDLDWDGHCLRTHNIFCRKYRLDEKKTNTVALLF